MAKSTRDTLKALGERVIKNLNAAGMKLGAMYGLYEETEKQYGKTYPEEKQLICDMIDIVKVALDAAVGMNKQL